MSNDELYDDELDHDFDEADEVEAYCMSCREKTVMDNPTPIWTRRGAPGTRGTCSICGTTMFLMGKTPAHNRLTRPEPVQIIEPGRGGLKIPATVTYLNFGVQDGEFAEILAEDLKRIGIQTWMAEDHVRDPQWATGIHPALTECKNMVVILTPLGIKATNVQEALNFFLTTNKPVFVALLQDADVPDVLRRKPRFDFRGDDYKRQFRQLAGSLTGG
ncbi:MAG: toll/interleukin-1 receptor domain-containing protein [Anaerolineae bacterium]|nr:toll/interleukin-1 receptor domain-containing protein [Anaerolineae bacterium]